MDGTVVVHLDNPDAPATLKRSGSMDEAHSGTLRCGQALSGTLRYAQERSRTLCFNLDSTVSRATDTFDCFNGLQKPQRPSRPQAPKEPKEPQQLHGWMLSFDSRLPIPQLSVKNPKKPRIAHRQQLKPKIKEKTRRSYHRKILEKARRSLGLQPRRQRKTVLSARLERIDNGCNPRY